MDLMLTNRVALITGGASGIGRATALAFAAEGAHVALWDLERKGGGERLSEIRLTFPVKSHGDHRRRDQRDGPPCGSRSDR